MADDNNKMATDGWTLSTKGHTPLSPGKVQGDYEGPTGDLGGLPTTGTVVSKPPKDKRE